METIRQRWLAMLIHHCKTGQKEHAWYTAKELDKNELLEGISAELEAHMKSLNTAQRKNGG